ncbi:hypothetical protein ACMYSQ_009410 [Aspergillus niger]
MQLLTDPKRLASRWLPLLEGHNQRVGDERRKTDDDDDCWCLVFPLSGIESPVSARFNLRPATFLNSFWISSLHRLECWPDPLSSASPIMPARWPAESMHLCSVERRVGA